MRRSRLAHVGICVRSPLVSVFVLVACGPQVTLPGGGDGDAADGATTTANDDGATTTVPPSMTTSTPPPNATSTTAVEGTTIGDVSTDDGVSFILPTGCSETDGAEAPPGTSFHCTQLPCDTFLQDCPEGEKCTVWANDGGPVWNATRCVPVSDDPAGVGASCTMEGSPASGLDDCDLGLMCWGVDEATLEGRCEALCGGALDNPTCAQDHLCSLSSGPLALCLPTCQPLTTPCPIAEEVCVPFADLWLCAPPDANSLPGEECDYVNACTASTVCAPPDAVPGCGGNGCCSALCDLAAADPDAPCLPGQTCVPWYRNAQAPPGYEDIGVCAL